MSYHESISTDRVVRVNIYSSVGQRSGNQVSTLMIVRFVKIKPNTENCFNVCISPTDFAIIKFCARKVESIESTILTNIYISLFQAGHKSLVQLYCVE